MKLTQYDCGFSLFELMLVVAVISILIGLVYPSYQFHLNKVRRKEVEIELMAIANDLEHFYEKNNNSYNHATLSMIGYQTKKALPYAIDLVVLDSGHYLINAIPLGSQQKDACGTLTLNEMGKIATSLMC